MRKTIYLFTLGLVVVVLATLAGAGLVVSAQNTNSSMTHDTNTAKAKPNVNPRKPTKAYTSGRCDPMKQEQTDLSGTYTGKAQSRQ